MYCFDLIDRMCVYLRVMRTNARWTAQCLPMCTSHHSTEPRNRFRSPKESHTFCCLAHTHGLSVDANEEAGKRAKIFCTPTPIKIINHMQLYHGPELDLIMLSYISLMICL